MSEQLTYNIKPLVNNCCKIVSITPLEDITVFDEIKIPSEIDDHKVIGINKSAACSLCRKATVNKLVIPNTIESIGEYTFSHINIKNVIFE